jgi:hypothetical protein
MIQRAIGVEILTNSMLKGVLLKLILMPLLIFRKMRTVNYQKLIQEVQFSKKMLQNSMVKINLQTSKYNFHLVVFNFVYSESQGSIF